MGTFVDDRTEEQKKTHTFAVVGTDSYNPLGQEQGYSYAGWACRPEELYQCEYGVRSRGDMRRVRIVTLNGYRPNVSHCHIYVWMDGKKFN